MTNEQSLFGLIDQISKKDIKDETYYLDIKQNAINQAWRLDNCPDNYHDIECYADRRGI